MGKNNGLSGSGSCKGRECAIGFTDKDDWRTKLHGQRFKDKDSRTKIHEQRLSQMMF